jgi:segregation and condensation protein A
MSQETLTDSMVDLIKREKRKYTVVKRDRLSIKEKLIELKNNLKVGSKTTLDKLINDKLSTEETVITFISILELARLQKLDVYQNEQMGEVYVDVREALDSFDVETADGFEPEEEDNGITSEDILLNTKKTDVVQASSL